MSSAPHPPTTGPPHPSQGINEAPLHQPVDSADDDDRFFLDDGECEANYAGVAAAAAAAAAAAGRQPSVASEAAYAARPVAVPAMATSSRELPTEIIWGPLIGEGFFGRVFYATLARSGRAVVLKELKR